MSNENVLCVMEDYEIWFNTGLNYERVQRDSSDSLIPDDPALPDDFDPGEPPSCPFIMPDKDEECRAIQEIEELTRVREEEYRLIEAGEL